MVGQDRLLPRWAGVPAVMWVLFGAAFAAAQPTDGRKEIWAKRFLGSRPPELHVETWLTDPPEMQGKVVLIDFWATWCRPCRDMILLLNRLHDRFGDRLTIIGLTHQKPKVLRMFLDRFALKYAVATDTKKRTYTAYGVRAIPHVVIMGTDGLVKWEGFPTLRGYELTEQVVAGILKADPGLKAATSRPAGSPDAE